MVDGSLSQIPLPTVHQIQFTPLRKRQPCRPTVHETQLSHTQTSRKKSWTHHGQKPENDVSNSMYEDLLTFTKIHLTCLLLLQQQLQQRSYQPWGCCLRRSDPSFLREIRLRRLSEGEKASKNELLTENVSFIESRTHHLNVFLYSLYIIFRQEVKHF